MSFTGGIRKLLRAVRRGPTSHAVVLMYHRVAECDIDPWGLCISQRRFAEHLEALKRSYRVASLRELTRPGAQRGTVAITFDDGYADNFHQAAPLLERHEIPATFFLTSGALGASREFWWDELDRLLLRTSALPPALRITAGDECRVFEPGRAAPPPADLRGEIRADPPWKAPPDTRLGFYYAMWQFLRTLDEGARRAALDEIGMQLGQVAAARDSHRTLTIEEARRLASIPRVDIGAHSVTHAALSLQSPAAQAWEMRQSKQDLEQLLGRPIAGFAYPFGDYGPETVELARQAGFEFACTTDGGGITRGADPYRLPRLGVENCDGAQLIRQLERILG